MKVCFDGLYTETSRNFSEIKIFRKITCDCNRLIINTNTYVDLAYFTVSAALACVAFFLVILAENSRLPVDNPDTHLELTMIHEGMTLEYSGPLLTLIHLGRYKAPKSVRKTITFNILPK